MAEEFLEKIYREADAYTNIKNLISVYYDGESDSNFEQAINNYIQVFVDLSKDLCSKGDERGEILWESLVALSKVKKLIVCLDILEINILPIVFDYIKNHPRVDVDDGEGVILRSSELGFLYLIDTKSMIRCNSAYNPMQEAYEIVRAYYKVEKYDYVLLGCGLGYIPYQLFLQSEGEIHMTIYFHDQKSYNYAKLYGVLEWIPKECIDIIVTDDILNFLCDIRDSRRDYYIYKPDITKYPQNEMESLTNIIVTQNTKFATNKYVNINFYRNTRRVNKYIDDFDRTRLTDRFIIVAGGPSVDENIDFIKNCRKKGITIISVGTVFKKLLNNGIIPDIVTACDPFVTCSKQFENIENNVCVPFFLGLETDYRAAKYYSGPKYLVPTESISRFAQEFVYDKNYTLLRGTTTVTSFSYCIAVYLGATEIYLVGADYGYPGGYTHAEGTNLREVISEKNCNQVRSNDGTMIYTSGEMILYRDEMENLIKENNRVKTYNLSRHGAYIEGAALYDEEVE